MYPAVAITVSNKIVGHFVVVFHVAEAGVVLVSPAIVSFAAPALWAIIGVIYRKAESDL